MVMCAFSFILLRRCITWIGFHTLSYQWPWYIIFLMWSSIWFASILSRILASVWYGIFICHFPFLASFDFAIQVILIFFFPSVRLVSGHLWMSCCFHSRNCVVLAFSLFIAFMMTGFNVLVNNTSTHPSCFFAHGLCAGMPFWSNLTAWVEITCLVHFLFSHIG